MRPDVLRTAEGVMEQLSSTDRGMTPNGPEPGLGREHGLLRVKAGSDVIPETLPAAHKLSRPAPWRTWCPHGRAIRRSD